ncbi:Ribbon-helix-helix protein, CopG family [Hyphomicrobiales bacterium]|nr:Ribbon-helix-helix protein, CopG family [Hyphomicrobiales bacterium]
MLKTQKPERNKGGRPSVDSEAITLRLPRELIDAIDNQRRIEADLPNRQEMIRRIIVQWREAMARSQ